MASAPTGRSMPASMRLRASSTGIRLMALPRRWRSDELHPKSWRLFGIVLDPATFPEGRRLGSKSSRPRAAPRERSRRRRAIGARAAAALHEKPHAFDAHVPVGRLDHVVDR